MKTLPQDPTAQHQRLIAALCQDFATPEFMRTGSTPRANAVVEIARQLRGVK
jgi:hypothetical protein